MRIGISILTRAGHDLWSSGIDQNVYHLACLLDAIPFVERVVLIDTGDQGHPPRNAGPLGERFALLSPTQAQDCIDVAIEMSGGLDMEWLARFRARGGKVVLCVCGQPYAALIEPATFNRPGFFAFPERCDELWLLEKDWPFAAMMSALHRCPVFELPYLWAPCFLDERIEAAAKEGLSYGYVPGAFESAGVIPAILEPNISPIKMGLIPYLACEMVQRLSPQTLGQVHLMNSQHMAEQSSFIFFIQNSDIYRAGKLGIGARDYISHVMGRGANMVVSHQQDCAQNYLYLDALYGAYPLVHNSPWLGDLGYYYDGSDVAAAASAIMRARQIHDEGLDRYRASADALIARLSPTHGDNRSAYARRLVGLSAQGRAAA